MDSQSGQLATVLPFRTVTPVPQELRKLRVLLDARKLGHGGIGTYIENLITAFLELGIELTVIGSRAALLKFGLLDYVGIIDDDAKPYSIDELFFLSRRIEQERFDVFHSPHYTLPYGLRIPSVVTVHDLIHIHHPERFFYPMVARPMIRSALRRATRILTVSEASRADIIGLMGRGSFAEKITVVPNAVDVAFEQITPERKRKNYLLAVVSNNKPHKGLSALLDAFYQVTTSRLETVPRDLKLVIVGQGAARLADINGAVVPMGPVSKEKLSKLYHEALGLVVPSRAEGFCLPALEAHACGTPVISTPIPAVREILGDADVICPGFAPADIAQGIMRFLESPTVRREISQHDSYRWVEQYSRHVLARRVLSVYGEAVQAKS